MLSTSRAAEKVQNHSNAKKGRRDFIHLLPQQRQLFNYMRPGRRQHRTQGARLCVLQDDRSDAGLSAGNGGSVGKE
jgi:hypothetical protein